MPDLIIWKDQRINKLKKDMDHMFRRVWSNIDVEIKLRRIGETPPIDISETTEDLILLAEIPGVDPHDFDIVVDDETLTITYQITKDTASNVDSVHHMERRYGSFARTLRLPCRIHAGDVNATYKKGILKIVMPKCKREPARRIKIKLR